ncbi:MAG: hypothetical protein AB7C98_09525 [Acidithiobacillus sp.]|uniref:hypothetical protein n=1 Tax=Marinobacter sp. UBA2678 TaxID=1946815 RepID=UPI00257E0094|nr:hypothetical protein [Marinobacter sp. UBA2678]
MAYEVTDSRVLLLVTGLLATAAVRAWANHRNLLVIPSDRCSHEIPTPHGGGIAIAILIITLGILALAFSWLPDQTPAWAFIGLGAAMLAIGVWDDFGQVSPKIRLGLHFLVAIIGLMSLPALPVLSFFGFQIDTASNLLLWPLLIAAWVWLINLYNFMDGIDGLAALQALLLFAGMALNFWYVDNQDWAWVCVFMASAVLSLMVFNWPPAKFRGPLQSPFRSCASLRSLWPTHGRTFTSRSAPGTGAPKKGRHKCRPKRAQHNLSTHVENMTS